MKNNIPGIFFRAVLFLQVLSILLFSEGKLPETGVELIKNGNFANGLDSWSKLWTRDSDAGVLSLDQAVVHAGSSNSVKIEHKGDKDWSFNCTSGIPVTYGDIFEFEGWVKMQGLGNVEICVTTFDDGGKVLNWSYAAKTAYGKTDAWQRLYSKFYIPKGTVKLNPRFIGNGPSISYISGMSLIKKGNIFDGKEQKAFNGLELENGSIKLTVNDDASFTVLDKRKNISWKQKQSLSGVMLIGAEKNTDALILKVIEASTALELKVIVKMEKELPEFAVTIEAQNEKEFEGRIDYPYPFATPAGTSVIIPMNEGISYPVDDTSINPASFIAYGGHGICMAFFGATDGEAGEMAILETANDARAFLNRMDGLLSVGPEWDPEKGRFGYSRQLRYVFFDKGGHVSMCKRYREYARKTGNFRTLEEKKRDNPNVDLLIGSVNIWYFDKDALSMAKKLKADGIERILWSNAEPPETVKAMNGLNILTGEYDIYQDVMDPGAFSKLRYIHSGWPTAAWPNDLILDAKKEKIKGWEVETKDGGMYPCGVLCDKEALKYARERVPKDLANRPFKARFIDTTTASPFRECYSDDHPMTRTESRKYKMELLKYMSEDMKLVTGSETGHDAAVPYVDYFEGMLSLGPYRLKDSGRNMQQIVYEVPENLEKFQLGQKYRLPLWELVYHDCVVAEWYWGDYNNKLPKLWDKRDLFNILYGTSPLFMFTGKFFTENEERFIQSYKNVCETGRKAGYTEMVDHRFLTADRDVQQTEFSNGVVITVNFGGSPYTFEGSIIKPLGFLVTNKKLK